MSEAYASMSIRPTTVLAAVAGTLIGLACAAGGLLIGGAGHGWGAAAPFGVLSLVLTPLAFVWLARAQARALPRWQGRRMLAAAGVLDLLLLLLTLHEGPRYFLRGWQESLSWLGLWSAWQLAALGAWLLAGRPAASTPTTNERGPDTP